MSAIWQQVRRACLALALAGLTGTAAAADLAAIELIELQPETLLERLDAARSGYDGTQPDELLQLLALLAGRPASPLRPAIREAVLDLLLEWPDSLEPALRKAEAASAPAMRQASVIVQRALSPPADGPSLPSAETSVVGRDYLAGYPGIPRVDPTAASVLIVDVTAAQRDPFTPSLLAAMNGVLARGGVLLIAAPDAPLWPTALQAWAHAQGVALPAGRRPLLGPGMPAAGEGYRSLAESPWSPVDQPGPPANAAWEQWNGAAPIVASDGAGALVVVQSHQGGTMLFTCVDLVNRPLYRDNLLYWIYGKQLAAAQQAFPGEWDLAVTGQTPHQPWLKPAPDEPPRVLYLTDNLFKRGLLELHQRLDITHRYIPYEASLAMLPARPPHPAARLSLRTALALEEALPWAEVLLCEVGRVNLLRSLTQETMGDVSIELLPRRLRRQLYAAVHSRGLGLVVVGEAKAAPVMPDLVARLAEATPWATGMAFLPDNVCQIATRGKGRIVWMMRRLEHLDVDFPRLPEDELDAVWQVPGLERPRQPLRVAEYAYAGLARVLRHAAGRELLVSRVEPVNGAPVLHLARQATGHAELLWRDAYGRVVETRQIAFDGRQIELPPPRLVGPTVAECRLVLADGKVADAVSIAVLPTAEPAIRGIHTDQAWYAPGDMITATTNLAPDQRGELTLEVRDTWGRLLHRSTGVQASFPVVSPLSRLWDLEATWRDETGAVVSYFRQPVGIVLPRRELDYDITGVVPRHDTLLPLIRDEMGVTVTFGDAEAAIRGHLELSAGIWSDAVGVSPTPGARTSPTERQPCLSSTSFRLQALRDLREAAPRWVRLGITDYMIADECPLGPRCLSPATLARFRDWLRGEYADLAALNDEWGTTFANWDAVAPLTAGSLDRPGSYVDYDRFHHWEFAEYASYLQLIADDLLPGFQTGHSGGLSDDWMMHQSSALWYYGVNEAAVAAKRPGALIGSWYEPGYRFREDHEVEARRWAWWHLFRGTTRLQLWYPKTLAPAIHADLSRPYAAYTWLNEEMTELRRGMGKLLLHARRDEGRVAVYTSLRNQLTHAALAELAGERPPPVSMGGDFQRAVLARQAECRYVNPLQVEAGELVRRSTRLLYLPSITCLSPGEREVLTAFVEAGGILLADFRPGARNHHGTVVDDGWAAAMFGAPTTGRVDTPRGQGRCILLNGPLPDDPALIDELLRLAGVVPRLRVEAADGTPIAVDRGLFADGDALYAGIVENGKGAVASTPKRPVTLRFTQSAHLYDSRAGHYLGYVDQHETTLQPGVAHLYAALPWQLTAIRVDAGNARPGENVILRLTSVAEGAVGRQLLLVRVADPDGRWLSAHEQRLLVSGGTADVRLPLALDAAPGAWRIVVRDAATGVTGEALLEVSP